MIEKLKESIETKFGKKITYQKDCKLLSIYILETTGEYLSPATLRRIFGFLITNSNPSRVTLDILSRYIGLENWAEFTEKNKHAISNHFLLDDYWLRAQEKSKIISNHTIDQIKRRSGINFNQTINRQFADEFIDHFLKCSFNATSLIGPGGFGKSTLLANWYLKNSGKKKFSSDIIIFEQAVTLDVLANSETLFEDWLMRILGIAPENNILDYLSRNRVNSPGKFIIIIDALDESTAQGAKLEKVFTSLANFQIKYSGTNWFKIIFTARFYTWSKFRKFISNVEYWYNIKSDDFTPEGANMPMLSYEEIQKIIDNTINTKYSGRKLLEEFNIDLRETLSYPYFLQLFINVYHPETEYLLHDQLEIFREFIKKQVHSAQFSEEKTDILDKIIELTELGLKPYDVKKNTLKEIYPVHLKLAGNYYAAYEDLLSFGLIVEEEVESKFGGYAKIVRISNQTLFEILLVQNILDKEGGISFELLKKIEEQYAGTEILPSLIILIFQFAYKDRLLEPLEKFFDLKKETLDRVLSSPAIIISLRRDDFMRKKLIPTYIKIPRARKYLFETYPDINSIVGSFSFCLTHYPLNSKNSEEKINSSTLNVYAGFLCMDSGRIDRYFKQIQNYIPNVNHNPSMVGRWFACMCMYQKLIKGSNPKPIIEQALEFLKTINISNNEQVGQFENALFPALIIINQFDILEQLADNEFNTVKNYQIAKNKSVITYYYLSKLSQGKQLDSNDIIQIDMILSQANPTDSYQQRILGLVLKASYFLKNKNISKAYENIRNATELSNIAGYKLIDVKLLKTLSKTLVNLGEITKANECNKFAESITDKTGFNYEIL